MSVVIPTYNEAQSIGLVLRDIPSVLVEQVIVVDSDSTDGTVQIAREMGAKVLHEPRRGYGRACLTGLAASSDADVVVFLDGDYSDRPAEMSRLLEPLRDGIADMVIGSRLCGERMVGAMPWHAVFGNRLAARLIALLSGIRLTDLGPFRAARYQALIALGLREPTYGWPVEMIVKGARRGLRITEVPVSYYPRIGSSKISGTVRGSVGAAWGIFGAILKYRFFDASFTRKGNV
ncbi:MAG TPA: glycosyltransferase family 2 protein [Candidatus Binataceae bacterium]|nr:glycosyltransferase family 2 protein [Candidatus Binataceae bacterium]